MQGNITITKERFIKIMNTLKNQNDYRSQVYDTLSELFTDGGGFPKDEYLSEELISILRDAFHDNNEISIIDYFMYELNFGVDWTEESISESGEIIDISTSEKLYDHLMSRYNE